MASSLEYFFFTVSAKRHTTRLRVRLFQSLIQRVCYNPSFIHTYITDVPQKQAVSVFPWNFFNSFDQTSVFFQKTSLCIFDKNASTNFLYVPKIMNFRTDLTKI
jgi:hypothetical protein